MSQVSKMRLATKEITKILGTIPLFVRIKDQRVLSQSKIVQGLRVSVLLETTYLDQTVRGIFYREHKIVRELSKSVVFLRRGTENKVSTILSCDAPWRSRTNKERCKSLSSSLFWSKTESLADVVTCD